MEKRFPVNQDGYSIRCRLFCNQSPIRQTVLFCHGFGGNKDNMSVKRFAQYVLPRHNDVGVLAFDWPCHGEDALRKLSLDACDRYLELMIDYARTALGTDMLYACASSFGAFVILKYISEHHNPFFRIALRCPAVNMYQLVSTTLADEGEQEKLARGKDALIGFSRKIRITAAFVEELRQSNITEWEYTDFRNQLLILHGTKDEIVPIDAVRQFAEQNGIPFIPITNADHRFVDPGKMKESIEIIQDFFWPYSGSDELFNE